MITITKEQTTKFKISTHLIQKYDYILNMLLFEFDEFKIQIILRSENKYNFFIFIDGFEYFDNTSNNLHYEFLLKLILKELNFNSYHELYNHITDNKKIDNIEYYLLPSDDSILNKFDWNLYWLYEDYNNKQPKLLILGFILLIIVITSPIGLFLLTNSLLKYIKYNHKFEKMKWFDSKDVYDYKLNKFNFN